MGQWWNDTDREKWGNCGMILKGENRSTQTKTCLSGNRFPIHPTETGLESNPGIRDERSATHLPSYTTGDLKSVYLTQDRGQLRAVVGAVMNPQVP
jgi:hypothetical protein